MIPTTEQIVTYSILNEETGEVTKKDFREIKQWNLTIKGGYKKMYSSYEQALIKVCNSSKDIEIFTFIKDKFTYQKIEVIISPTNISKELSVSKSKVSKIIADMVKYEVLKRIDRGTYRLNPFMFLPYKSDGLMLQAEWTNLK